jgi:hypothetical protein
VTLTRDFEIRQTEVTQVEWQAAGFDLPNKLSKSPCSDCGIAWITVYEAMAYCNALSQKAGLAACYDLSNCSGTFAGGCPDEPLNDFGCRDEDAFVCMGKVQIHEDPYSCPGYRLPATAEWEYAARSGTRTATYAGDLEEDVSGLNEPHPLVDTIAWHGGNVDISQHPVYMPVAQKQPNGFGLYDMLGNMAEFCGSTSHNRSLEDLVGLSGPLVDPKPPLEEFHENMEIVMRGASTIFAPCYCRSAFSSTLYARERISWVGFRPVRTLSVSTMALSRSSTAVGKSK